jgi:glutamyl-Q tRNA(Asp) synthetase
MNAINSYRGRFAPSPSGPLHFGSLVSALCSYLQARSNFGHWSVRIEDIDPPREVAGASDLILKALDIYGLHWDGVVCYQSQRLNLYQEYLQQLNNADKTFNCDCTRSLIKQNGGVYLGYCKDRNLPHSANTSIRYKPESEIYDFHDQLQGEVVFPANSIEQNFILKRKDGLFAYQLAVVVDDWLQNITEVVRGLDLLDSTPKQLQLLQSFNAPKPVYFHHPLVVDKSQLKLSKQNKAKAIDLTNPVANLIAGLKFLGQKIPQHADQANVEEILQFAIDNWNPASIPKTQLDLGNV